MMDKNVSKRVLVGDLLFLAGLCSMMAVDSVAVGRNDISPAPTEDSNLELKVEHMNQLDRKYVERMRRAMIEANPKEATNESSFLLNPTNEDLSKGIGLYLEQKTGGSVFDTVKNKFGVDDYRLMFSIYIVNPCMQVALELDSFMANKNASDDGFASEWLQITRMCRTILDNKDTLKERSFRMILSHKK